MTLTYIDIIILVIIGLGVLFGLINGAVKTIISIFSWLVAIAVSYFIAPIVANALLDIEMIRNLVIGSSGSIFSIVELIPDLLINNDFVAGLFEPFVAVVESADLGSLTSDQATTLMIAYALFSAIVFIAIVILIRVIAFIIKIIVDMVHQVLPVGIVSRLVGMVLGAVKGGIHVALLCVVFMYFVPIGGVSDAIESSTIGNPLMNMVSQYSSSLVVPDYEEALDKLINYAEIDGTFDGSSDEGEQEPTDEPDDSDVDLDDGATDVADVATE